MQTAEEFLRLFYSKKLRFIFSHCYYVYCGEIIAKNLSLVLLFFPLKPFVYMAPGQVVCPKISPKANLLLCSFLVQFEPCKFKGLEKPNYIEVN